MTVTPFPSKAEPAKRLDEMSWPIHASEGLGKPFGDINGSIANPPEQEVNDLARFKDAINPPHYKEHPSGVECIQITEHMGFCLGNAVKYIWRAGLKESDRRQDLEKAIWYIQRELRKA
jgi:hypothetical protein